MPCSSKPIRMLMDLFLVLIFILISLKDYYNGFEEAD